MDGRLPPVRGIVLVGPLIALFRRSFDHDLFVERQYRIRLGIYDRDGRPKITRS